MQEQQLSGEANAMAGMNEQGNSEIDLAVPQQLVQAATQSAPMLQPEQHPAQFSFSGALYHVPTEATHLTANQPEKQVEAEPLATPMDIAQEAPQGLISLQVPQEAGPPAQASQPDPVPAASAPQPSSMSMPLPMV